MKRFTAKKQTETEYEVSENCRPLKDEFELDKK